MAARNHVRFNFDKYLERWARGIYAWRIDELVAPPGDILGAQPDQGQVCDLGL